MISPKSLISTAPLKEETKNDLSERFETLEEAKQMQIVDLCWNLISSELQTKLSIQKQKMMLEMAEQKANYTTTDFDKIEENMLTELFQKLEAFGNEQKIKEVRNQLEIHSDTQNTTQDIPAELTDSSNNSSSL